MLASDSPTLSRVLKHDASSMAPSPPIRKPVWHHHHSCGDTCTLQRALSPPHVHVDPDVLAFLLDILHLPFIGVHVWDLGNARLQNAGQLARILGVIGI